MFVGEEGRDSVGECFDNMKVELLAMDGVTPLVDSHINFLVGSSPSSVSNNMESFQIDTSSAYSIDQFIIKLTTIGAVTS